MPARKIAKAASSKRVSSAAKPNGICKPKVYQLTATPPGRAHSFSYHYPLLLSDRGSVDALFKWFEGIEEKRSMPWRKKWIDPEEFTGTAEELGAVLAKRAYEVWVSEIMLQQTRVSTVIPYFNTWISKWPTIQDLAKANHDDVLSAWKGLGYYSRATRLHQGAQDMVSQTASSACPIPSGADELQNFSGIGRYTAGAVASIAFGVPEPVLDGNVARVLSRQLGLYVDAKDKKSSDALWDIADRLVKDVSEYPNVGKSKVPSLWNQGLMELGSTICTPRPKCDECPVQKTCRAYAEGVTLFEKQVLSTTVPDIEDACSLCEQLDTEELVAAPEVDGVEEEVAVKPAKKRKADPKASNTISHYFTASTPTSKVTVDENNENANIPQAKDSKKRKAAEDTAKANRVAAYCALFPKKVPKKKAAEEEAVVCIMEGRLPDGDSRWLIEQRPAKGLLASLWQFPQSTLKESEDTAASRKIKATSFVRSAEAGAVDTSAATHVADLGSLVHVFTHLRLTMHVQRFRVDIHEAQDLQVINNSAPARKWIKTDEMDGETLSTGMKRCWDLIK